MHSCQGSNGNLERLTGRPRGCAQARAVPTAAWAPTLATLIHTIKQSITLLVTLPLLSRTTCAPCDAGIQTTYEGPQGLSFGPLLGFIVKILLKFSPRLLKKFLTLFVIFRCVPTQISPWVNKIWGWGLLRPQGTDEFYGIP